MGKITGTCAACGRPGHRYGRNEGPDRFDPQACINGLLFELERIKSADLYEEGWRDAIRMAMDRWGAEDVRRARRRA